MNQISSTRRVVCPFYNSLQDVPDVPEGVFLYGGAMASAALRAKNIQSEITRAHPKFRLLYTDPLNVPSDSDKGIEMTANGEISFSESFRPIQQTEYNIVRSRGYNLKQVPVVLEGIAFYSHPGVRFLSTDSPALRSLSRGWQFR